MASRSRSPSPERNDGADAPAPAPAADAAPSYSAVKLYVGNLSYNTDDGSLRNAFGVHGEITDVFLPTDRMSGRPRGFAFVTLVDQASADKAIAALDQTELDGRTIRVNVSKPKEDGPTPGSGGFNAQGLTVST